MEPRGAPDDDDEDDIARRARLRRALILRRQRLNQRDASQLRSASTPSFAYPVPDEPVMPSMQPAVDAKAARKLRNRESAQRSREKKRRHAENLEGESDELSTFIQQVTHENEVLKEEIRRNIDDPTLEPSIAHPGSSEEE